VEEPFIQPVEDLVQVVYRPSGPEIASLRRAANLFCLSSTGLAVLKALVRWCVPRERLLVDFGDEDMCYRPKHRLRAPSRRAERLTCSEPSRSRMVYSAKRSDGSECETEASARAAQLTVSCSKIETTSTVTNSQTSTCPGILSRAWGRAPAHGRVARSISLYRLGS